MKRPDGARVLLAVAAITAALSGGSASAGGDPCATATVIPPAGPFPQVFVVDTSEEAASAAAVPSFVCGVKGNGLTRAAYFSFTPAVTDSYQLDTIGSEPASYDTILGVFAGSCDALTPLANGCSDDTTGSLQSSVALPLTAGTPYLIVVAAVGTRDPVDPAQVTPGPGGTLHLNVKRASPAYPYQYLVPSVARTGGYTSDLYVGNLGAADGLFLVQFLGHGKPGDVRAPASQPILGPLAVGVGGTRELVDVLGSFGVSNDWGALLVKGTKRLAVGARTSSAAPEGGTVGQYGAGIDVSTGLLSVGETGRLVGVREDLDFRTNVALVNFSTAPCAVELELRGRGGDLLGASRQSLPPSTMVQLSGLKTSLNVTDDVRSASITARNATPGCTATAAAFVIDRKTSDPFAIEMRK